MTTVLDATPLTASHGIDGQAPSSRGAWQCPECLVPVHGIRSHKLFCCQEHRRAWHNRWLTRGAVLAPLHATDRATRGGTRGDTATGSRARCDSQHLVQRWKDEDAAAGRMPIARYMAERYRLGLVEVA